MESITYTDALRQPSPLPLESTNWKLKGKQPVSWEGAPIVPYAIQFETIGPVTVPLRPPLPIVSMVMENHPAWVHFGEILLEISLETPFEEIDRKVLDLELLERTTGYHAGYFFRPAWSQWVRSFESAWEERETQVADLFQSAVADKFPTTIGNRVMPPSLVDTLKMMLAEAEKMEKNNHHD